MALWIGLMLASCGGVLGMLFYRRKKGGGREIRLSNKQNRQKRLRAGFVQNPQPAPAQPVSFSRREYPFYPLVCTKG